MFPTDVADVDNSASPLIAERITGLIGTLTRQMSCFSALSAPGNHLMKLSVMEVRFAGVAGG